MSGKDDLYKVTKADEAHEVTREELIRAFIEEGGDVAIHQEKIARLNGMALDRMCEENAKSERERKLANTIAKALSDPEMQEAIIKQAVEMDPIEASIRAKQSRQQEYLDSIRSQKSKGNNYQNGGAEK